MVPATGDGGFWTPQLKQSVSVYASSAKSRGAIHGPDSGVKGHDLRWCFFSSAFSTNECLLQRIAMTKSILLGYVSDESDLALAGVAVEIDQGSAHDLSYTGASGAVYSSITTGDCRVTLAKAGYGPKQLTTHFSGTPLRLRLLSDAPVGYMWPKWIRSGDNAEFRVHATESFRVDLWRYGLDKVPVRELGWFDEHGPRSMTQLLPEGDFTRSGVKWNDVGYRATRRFHKVASPMKSGLYYLHLKTYSGAFFSFPWIVAPSSVSARVAVIAPTNTWNAYNNFGGRSNYVNATGIPGRPVITRARNFPGTIRGASRSGRARTHAILLCHSNARNWPRLSAKIARLLSQYRAAYRPPAPQHCGDFSVGSSASVSTTIFIVIFNSTKEYYL